MVSYLFWCIPAKLKATLIFFFLHSDWKVWIVRRS